jgi:hypothetical protein
MPTDQPTPAPRCSAVYPSTSKDPNTRIVHCELPAGHEGDHEEVSTESSWPACCPGESFRGDPHGFHADDCPVYLASVAAWEASRPRVEPQPWPPQLPSSPTRADVDAAYERGKAEQAEALAKAQRVADSLGRRLSVRFEEIEKLRAQLEHAEQYARDFQDGEGWDREEQWALSYALNGTPQEPGHGGHVFDSRAEAQRHIEAWQRHNPNLTYADVTYHRREVLTGEWQPETGGSDAA